MTIEGTTRTNDNGNELTETFVDDADRYLFDFNLCSATDGWLTLETKSDAPYFGVWVHPEKLETMQYVEGDVYHTVCTSPESYAKEIDDMIECYSPAPGFVSIDGDGNATAHYQSRESYLPPNPNCQ